MTDQMKIALLEAQIRSRDASIETLNNALDRAKHEAFRYQKEAKELRGEVAAYKYELLKRVTGEQPPPRTREALDVLRRAGLL